jgi:hypothetical protein
LTFFDSRRVARLSVGQFQARAHPRRHIEGDYALTESGVSVQDGQLPQGKASRPKPLHMLGLYLRQERTG